MWGRLLGVGDCGKGLKSDPDDITVMALQIDQLPVGVGAGEIPQGGKKQAHLLRRDAAVRGISGDGGSTNGPVGKNP